MSKKDCRRAVRDYLVARLPTVSELRDFCKLSDIPDAANLREESAPAAQALAIVVHCEKIGTAALSALADAIRATEGQEQLKAAALDALRILAEAPADARSRALRWRAMAARHGLPTLASALVMGFFLWLPGRARSLTLGRQLTVCDAAARDDRLTHACLEVIAHAARHFRPVAAGGITRLAMQPKLEKATRHELFRLAKMLDPRADFPVRASSALRSEFRKIQAPDLIPDWTDQVVLLAPADDPAASKVRNRLLGQAPVISSLRFELGQSLPDGHDMLDILMHATAARAIVGRHAREWVGATRALGVERMLQTTLPHFQSAEPAPSRSLDSFLFAGQALDAAQTAAGRGELAASAERLQEAFRQCGGSCSLAGVISTCTELVAIGLGHDAMAEAALKQLDSPETAQDHYLKALGRLVWQLWRGEVRSAEDQAGDWFDPIKQEALLRNVDERSRSLLITLAEGAKAVADLRQSTIIWSLSRVQRADRSDPFKNVGVLPSKPQHAQPPIKKALDLLTHIGWRDAALLMRSAAAPASSDETVGADLVLAIEQMSAKGARHLLPSTSLMVLPMAFYRSEELSAAAWDRALSGLVTPLAEITRSELQGPSPARVAQRLAMWLSMSNYMLSDEKLLGEVMDALAVSALADNSVDEYDFAQLASSALLLLPMLSQHTSMSDLTPLLTWVEKFENMQGKRFPVAGAVANLVLAVADMKNSRPAAAHDRLVVGLELMSSASVPKDSFHVWIAPALRYADAIALALDQRTDEAKKALAVAQSDMDKRLVELLGDPRHKQECQRISSHAHELAQIMLDLLSKSTTNRGAIGRIAALAKRIADSEPPPQQLPFGLAAARLASNAIVYVSAFYLGDASDPSLALLMRQAGTDIDSVLGHLPQNRGGAMARFARSLLAAGQTAAAASVTADTRLQEEALDALQKLLDEVAPVTTGPTPAGASRADRLVDLQLGAARVALDVLRRDRTEKWSSDKLWSVMAERLMGYLGSSLKPLSHDRGVLPTMLRVAQGVLQSTLDNQTAAARAKLDDALTTEVDELKGPLEILRAELELADGGDAKTALDLATKALEKYPSWRVCCRPSWLRAQRAA